MSDKNQGLNREDKLRYARQIAIPEIGPEGQTKLKQSKVFILGCGALGSIVAMQLAGAGVGTIAIADFDNVEVSNLQRQFFFKTNDAGQTKASVLKKRMEDLNPQIRVEVFHEFITRKKAEDIFKGYDFIVDATDNPESKRMVDEVSLKYGKGCTIGGVKDFSGQVLTLIGDCNRFYDIFGETGDATFLPCSMSGVAGPAAVLCGAVLASETIKFLIEKGDLLVNKIFIFDLLSASFRVLSL